MCTCANERLKREKIHIPLGFNEGQQIRMMLIQDVPVYRHCKRRFKCIKTKRMLIARLGTSCECLRRMSLGGARAASDCQYWATVLTAEQEQRVAHSA